MAERLQTDARKLKGWRVGRARRRAPKGRSSKDSRNTTRLHPLPKGWTPSGSAPRSLSNQPRKSRVGGGPRERAEDGGGRPRGAGGAGEGVLEATAPECAGLTGARARSAAAGGVGVADAGPSLFVARLARTLREDMITWVSPGRALQGGGRGHQCPNLGRRDPGPFRTRRARSSCVEYRFAGPSG